MTSQTSSPLTSVLIGFGQWYGCLCRGQGRRASWSVALRVLLALYRGFLALVGGSVRQFCSRGCSSSVVFATSVSEVIDDRECISSHRGFCGCCWRIHCHHGYYPSQSGGGEEFVCLYKTYAPRNEPVENHGVRGNAGGQRALRTEGITRRSQDHRTTLVADERLGRALLLMVILSPVLVWCDA